MLSISVWLLELFQVPAWLLNELFPLNLTEKEKEFREKVRNFLSSELDEELKRAVVYTTSVFVEADVALRWQRKLYEKGWVAPGWPVEHGGTPWSPMEHYIFTLEATTAGAPELIPMGIQMVGPVIIKYGNEDQQSYYLPRILSGEHYWCQGYSEPQAGSDLASLRCRAVRDGDEYAVNGTKIWTTHAHFATHIFCLVRTNPEVKPQEGISFLLIEMDSPGITVTPIQSCSGEYDVNQVFFDNVHVPVANRIGEEGRGWTYAKYLLGHERGGGFVSPRLLRDLAWLRELATTIEDGHGRKMLESMELKKRVAELEMDVLSLQQLEIDLLKRDPASINAATFSLKKTIYSETLQAMHELAMDVVGNFSAILDSSRPLYGHEAIHDLPLAITAPPTYLNFRAASIYGGTNEIQRSIIAKVVLGGG